MSEQGVSFDEMFASAKRELRIREDKYPKYVARGQLRANKAERELTVFRAIVSHLETQLGNNP